MRKVRSAILLVILPLFFLCAVLYLLPPVRSRVDWRVEQLRLQVRYALFPPEQAVFVPQDQQGQVAEIVKKTLLAMTPSPAPTGTATAVFTPGPTQPPTLTPTPTLQPTPLPKAVALKGVRYIDQHGLYNYCAPANLAMGLSYWGWKGSRTDTGKVLKPFDKDLNVMPYEMVDYVQQQTEYRALWREGGTPALLKTMIAAGYPVLVEKGAYIQDLTGKISWMGHYEVMTGYDDGQQKFIAQDSYFQPNLPVSYADLETQWRSFNYTFIVIYPSDKEDTVKSLLGPYWEEESANRLALQKAEQEMNSLSGIDLYFAIYNRGTSLVYLKDFAGAAVTYDSAFKQYESLDKAKRPWRMLWYQTGPYFAYYYAGRYSDLVSLATLTIDTATNPYLEESYYWRGLGEVVIGKQPDAIQDFRTALQYHPGFQPALDQLAQLGATP